MAEIGQVPGGGLPWGDIVKVDTPFTDRVSAQLLAQQADRKKYQQETTLKADELMNKELANVRSVDMNQVIDSYGKWKNISMQMMNPKVQADPKLYNQLQVQKNAALGATMAAINRSAQLNAQAKELVAERKGKPNLYADDFGERLNAFLNTPMDKIAQHPKYGDLTNPDAFRRTGGRTDFNKLLTTAAGQMKPIEGAEKVEKLNDLQTRYTPTLFGNTPAQYFESLRGQLAQAIPGQDAAAAWEAIPDQQKAAVDEQFRQMSPDRWKAITGQEKPQMIAAVDPNNAAENWAAYQAKIYALNAAPRAGTPRLETNQQAKMAKQFDQRVAFEALREGNREKLASMKRDWHNLDKSAKEEVMNGVVQDMLDQAKSKPAASYEPSTGGVVRQYDIPASTILKKEFAVPDEKGHPIPVDAFRLSEDGKTVTPIFFKPGQTGEKRAVNADLSKPMTIGEFKARAAKAMFGAKESVKETASTTTPAQTSTKKSIPGW